MTIEQSDLSQTMTSVERLKVLGILVHMPQTAEQIAARAGIDPQRLGQHLDFLILNGVIFKQEGLFALEASLIEDGFNEQNEYIPRLILDDSAHHVLDTYLNPDGSIRQIPAKFSRQKVLLDYLIHAFTPHVRYTEQEVNLIIRRFFVDTAWLRRDLINAGLLAREGDGSFYWRVLNKKSWLNNQLFLFN